MVLLQKTSPRWADRCVVAAPGPSLTPEIAAACRGIPVVAVNDAVRLLPFAAVLYACDPAWWDLHGGCRWFTGERWTSHGNALHDDKRPCAARHDLSMIRGVAGAGFSLDPALIHYGDNGGFQAVNLAGHFLGWRGRIILIGFDMRMVDGRRHFFGDHPAPLRQTGPGYQIWRRNFATAAARLPAGIEIVNCTPGSALDCFPIMDIADALPAAA